MKIVQNFTSGKHINRFPVIDLMIWAAGLNAVRGFGYKTKIYCTQEDIPFLHKWGLYDLYDEIDTNFLATPLLYAGIDETKFWSIRKLLCMNHEMHTSTEPFAFMDTDIILYRPLDLDGVDLLVWSPDPPGDIYCKWEYISKPQDYVMPPYVASTSAAWNCGILYFKNKRFWDIYYTHYYNFVYGNPGEILVPFEADDDSTIRNIWACNAEQRILRAVSTYYNWCTAAIIGEVAWGGGVRGWHYYILRAVWRRLDNPKYQLKPEAYQQVIRMLNECIHDTWSRLTPAQQKIFGQVPWLPQVIAGQILTEYK